MYDGDEVCLSGVFLMCSDGTEMFSAYQEHGPSVRHNSAPCPGGYDGAKVNIMASLGGTGVSCLQYGHIITYESFFSILGRLSVFGA